MSGLQQKEAAGTEEVPHRNLLVDRSLGGLLDHRSIGWLSHGEIVVGEEEAAGIHRCHYSRFAHNHPVVDSLLAARIRRPGCSRSQSRRSYRSLT